MSAGRYLTWLQDATICLADVEHEDTYFYVLRFGDMAKFHDVASATAACSPWSKAASAALSFDRSVECASVC